jgi:hypothetical protein
MSRPPRVSARGIVGVYVLVAGLWIAFSDRVATTLASGEEALTVISTVKGWAFVVVTSVLLAVMLSRFNAERARRNQELETEVAERERAEEHLQRLNRVLRTLGLANQALVRSPDESTLLRAFCSVIVEQGTFLGAWVGYREDDPAATIRPVAWSGPLDAYLGNITLSWNDPDRGSGGPAGTSIRDGRTVLIRDVAVDTTLAWRAEMLDRGFCALVALPLTIDGDVFGTLVIYAGDSQAFGPDEIDLLEELARPAPVDRWSEAG